MIRLKGYHTAGFERGASRLKEGLWVLVRMVFFQSAFPWPSSIRRRLLRAFGATVGEGVVIRSRVNFTFPWRISIGDHVWIGDEVMILSLAEVGIGSNSCISQRAFLCTGSHDFSRESFDLITRPIVIGEGCWVGAQAFVGPGVTFGASSRCLAGAVVARDVAPGSTVAGVPARELRVES